MTSTKTRISFLFVVVALFAACSSPKPAAKPAKTTVTHADRLRGGTSFSNAIVIMVNTERSGLDEEYKWLSINYPGYGLVRKTHVMRASRSYDVMRIKTKQGQLKDIYFDSTAFSGKH